MRDIGPRGRGARRKCGRCGRRRDARCGWVKFASFERGGRRYRSGVGRNRSWRVSGGRSAGREQLLELRDFLFELVDTKSEFVEGEGFEKGLDASRGGEGDEPEDGSAEEEQKKNEGELEHVVWTRANLSILFGARQRRGGLENRKECSSKRVRDGRDPISKWRRQTWRHIIC